MWKNDKRKIFEHLPELRKVSLSVFYIESNRFHLKCRSSKPLLFLCMYKTTGANANQNSVLVLQESTTDVTGSLIVYAAVDMQSITVVMNGGDSSCVALLPSGFAIVPDCVAESGAPITKAGSEGGSLLTVGFQILVNDLPSSKLTMESINTVINLISRTVQGIKEVVHSNQQGRQITS